MSEENRYYAKAGGEEKLTDISPEIKTAYMAVELVMVLSKALAAVNAPEKVTDDRSALQMPSAPEVKVGGRMVLLVVVLGALQGEHRESHKRELHWTATAHDECGGKTVDFVLCGVSLD